MSTLGSALRWPRRGISDVVVAVVALLVLALFVLRLPPSLLDALVALNLVIGVALLLTAIYVPAPVAFDSFPSVLLITTLFRLALSVATTRLILLDGHAGKIIDAFGGFVAGGSLVVGIVVFVIITAVQFIVVAKGAERVAEVAARFTLDAMPGAQLSIDSDLRAGLIDKDEARRRRRLLERESQLGGALDGAMKFVKGDAIASIVIVAVNLVGGLVIGVMQRGLSFGEAARVYTILTIGDGLVAQLPALLSAMAAGIIVTRTNGASGDRHLGETIGRQLLAHPRALAVTGGIALALAAVPGFPPLVFVALAASLLGGAWLLTKRRVEVLDAGGQVSSAHDLAPATIANDAPLVVRHGANAQHDAIAAAHALGRWLADTGHELGIAPPSPLVQRVAALAPTRCEIVWFDVTIAAADGGELKAQLPDVQHLLRRQAARWIGVQDASNLLDRLARTHPALQADVREVVTAQRLAEVLRCLVGESIPLRNLRDIFEALLKWGDKENDPTALAEFVRVALGRSITARHLDGQGRLHAVLTDADVEEELRTHCRAIGSTSPLVLPPARAAQIQAQMRRRFESRGAGDAPPPVVLAAIDVRRHVRKLLEPVLPDVVVLSYQELADPFTLVPVGHPALQAVAA
jgi:type III secretion protein V